MPERLIAIIGPTATGKTQLAAKLAYEIGGEILSADSRQIYKELTIGSGKDLNEYQIEGQTIPYHLIDIVSAKERFDVFQYQQLFYGTFKMIVERGSVPILCGGSGMYLEAVLNRYQMTPIELSESLVKQLETWPTEKLKEKLLALKFEQHNTTDLLDRERILQALKIAMSEMEGEEKEIPEFDSLIFGIRIERELLRKRIEERLQDRLDSGMIDEVEALLEKGISPTQLNYFGLEYKFINSYLQHNITYETMYGQLLQAIRKFAKRQDTWFRRMERKGMSIHWLDYEMPLEEKLHQVKTKLKNGV